MTQKTNVFRSSGNDEVARWAAQADSSCELDPRGGPPVVLVNRAAQLVVVSAWFNYPTLWAGVALSPNHAMHLIAHLCILERRLTGQARKNVEKLWNDIAEAHDELGGVAIVLGQWLEASSVGRTKREERGHTIQRIIAKGRIEEHAPVEELYLRPEINKALRYFGGVYENADRATVVAELAMKINGSQWREYGLTRDEACSWMAAYFAGVRRMHGRDALLKFRPVLSAHVARAAFRRVTKQHEAE